jgi:hypothetical protein
MAISAKIEIEKDVAHAGKLCKEDSRFTGL